MILYDAATTRKSIRVDIYYNDTIFNEYFEVIASD